MADWMVRSFNPASWPGSETSRLRVMTWRKPNESPQASGRMRTDEARYSAAGTPRTLSTTACTCGQSRHRNGKSNSCSFGATLPQMAVPETMKSTSPSCSCWTTSRSWPSVPLGNRRTFTAPPLIASTACPKRSPNTCSAVLPAVIECDRRKMSAPRSPRPRHAGATAAAPTAAMNRRRPGLWRDVRTLRPRGSRLGARIAQSAMRKSAMASPRVPNPELPASIRPGVGKRRGRRDDVLPGIGICRQGQLENAIDVRHHPFAVRARTDDVGQLGAAGADGELAQAFGGGAAGFVLAGEPFVKVVVPDDDDVRAELAEGPPDVAHHRRGAVAARREQRMVPDRGDAAGPRRGEVAAQPLHLRRAVGRGHIAVERDHVPGASGEAVVAQPRRPGALAEVIEICGRAGSLVFVVARRGEGAVLVPPPARVITLRELRRGSLEVRIVAGGEHDAVDFVEERGGAFRSGRSTHADVAGADEHG